MTDHNVRETLAVTDRAYIIHNGKIFRAGSPEALGRDPDVRRIYLGEGFQLSAPRPERTLSGAAFDNRVTCLPGSPQPRTTGIHLRSAPRRSCAIQRDRLSTAPHVIPAASTSGFRVK